MEVCEKYIEWLFELCKIEKDKTPKEAPELFYKHHNKEELTKALGLSDISEDTITSIRDVWKDSKPEDFCYCCGDLFLNAFSSNRSDIIERCCELIMKELGEPVT